MDWAIARVSSIVGRKVVTRLINYQGQVMLPDSDFNLSVYTSFSLNAKKDPKFAVHLYACGEASPPIACDESSKSEPT